MIVRTSKLRHTKGTEIGAKVEVRLTSRGNFIDDPDSFRDEKQKSSSIGAMLRSISLLLR